MYKPRSSTQEWCDLCLTKSCEECGEKFRMRSKAHVNRAKFCSPECRRGNWKKTMVGKKAPNYKEGQRVNTIEKTCKHCQNSYQTNEVHFSDSNFCTRTCHDNWRSAHLVGENATNWKGGVTEKRHRDMASRRYKCWREKVYERDNYTCRACNDNTGGNLNAHHIKSYSDYPKLRYKVENGLTLCEDCHRKVHYKGLDIQSELHI